MVFVTAEDGGEEEARRTSRPRPTSTRSRPSSRSCSGASARSSSSPLLMRLVPRTRGCARGWMPATRMIRGGHEQAEQVTDAARDDVAQYEAQLAAIRAEAQQRIEAARDDARRRARRAAGRGQRAHRRAARRRRDRRSSRPGRPPRPTSRTPCGRVAARAGELATGRTPDPSVVDAAVADVDERRGQPMIALPSPTCWSRVRGAAADRRPGLRTRRTRGSGPSRPS